MPSSSRTSKLQAYLLSRLWSRDGDMARSSLPQVIHGSFSPVGSDFILPAVPLLIEECWDTRSMSTLTCLSCCHFRVTVTVCKKTWLLRFMFDRELSTTYSPFGSDAFAHLWTYHRYVLRYIVYISRQLCTFSYGVQVWGTKQHCLPLARSYFSKFISCPLK
jgi:hypothetical protein